RKAATTKSAPTCCSSKSRPISNSSVSAPPRRMNCARSRRFTIDRTAITAGAASMNHSIATVSIGGALDEKLKTIAAAGFDAVEIFENDFTCFDGSARDVARMCGDLGLRICALQPFRDFEGLPEPQRKEAFRRAEKKFDLMGELGTDLLLVCSNVSPHALG